MNAYELIKNNSHLVNHIRLRGGTVIKISDKPNKHYLGVLYKTINNEMEVNIPYYNLTLTYDNEIRSTGPKELDIVFVSFRKNILYNGNNISQIYINDDIKDSGTYKKFNISDKQIEFYGIGKLAVTSDKEETVDQVKYNKIELPGIKISFIINDDGFILNHLIGRCKQELLLNLKIKNIYGKDSEKYLPNRAKELIYAKISNR